MEKKRAARRTRRLGPRLKKKPRRKKNEGPRVDRLLLSIERAEIRGKEEKKN
jgi:hypothetical protein